jgi:hypothetical protein
MNIQGSSQSVLQIFLYFNFFIQTLASAISSNTMMAPANEMVQDELK